MDEYGDEHLLTDQPDSAGPGARATAESLAEQLLDLCDAAESDNYGRVAVDVDDLRQIVADMLGVRWDDDLRTELRERGER